MMMNLNGFPVLSKKNELSEKCLEELLGRLVMFWYRREREMKG
jgi:hypothetical protein